MSDAVVPVFAAKVSAEAKIIDTDEVGSKKWLTGTNILHYGKQTEQTMEYPC